MLTEYWLVIVICFALLFLKTFAYGNFIRIRIAEVHNNKYYRKHKSKNFFVNYFYLNYFKENNKIVFIINLLLPIIAFLLFIIESFIFITNLEVLYPFGDLCFAIATFVALFAHVYAMLYSWWDSDESIGRILLATALILMPVISMFLC